MRLWTQVKAVLWSFIGLSGRKRDDVPAMNPIVVVVVAFVLVLALLAVLAFVAQQAAGLA